MHRARKYFPYVLLLLSAAVIIILIVHNNSLRIEISALQSNTEIQGRNIDALKTDVKQLQDELQQTNTSLDAAQSREKALFQQYSSLDSEYSKLDSNFSKLNADYSVLKKETDELLGNVVQYQTEIKESLEWYKANAELDETFEQRRVKRHIDNNCYKVYYDHCTIKLGCFYLLNQEEFGLRYKWDDETYGKDDRLASLSEFISNSGGDCEDYSLFFKAEYNYALSQCDGKDVVLEGWHYPGKGDKKESYWLNFQSTWYLADVVKFEIRDHTFSNIVCGNFYNALIDDYSGHCVIAFTKERIETLSDLQNLDRAYLIEPQDGSYRGLINDESSGTYLLDEEVWNDDSIYSSIFSVITDSDYYLFSEENLTWQSYQSFAELLEDSKKSISDSVE